MKQFLGVLPLNDGVNLLVTIHIVSLRWFELLFFFFIYNNKIILILFRLLR